MYISLYVYVYDESFMRLIRDKSDNRKRRSNNSRKTCITLYDGGRSDRRGGS